MTQARVILVALSDSSAAKELEGALGKAGFAQRQVIQPGVKAAELLAHNPTVVIFDTTALTNLPEAERHTLRQAGAQILLVYRPKHSSRLLADIGNVVADFIELPLDAARFKTQVERALEIAHLRTELVTTEHRSDADAQGFDSLLKHRTDERNEAENRAHRMETRLSDLDRLKSNLITIISHEFKTPLHLAAGYANLLTDGSLGALNDEQASAVGTIRKQLQRLADKLADIERIAQLEMGMRQEFTESVDIGVLLGNEIEGFRQAFEKKRLAVSLDITKGLPHIRGCQDFLADVMRRLIDNAIHYTPEGGNVNIRAIPHTNAASAAGKGEASLAQPAQRGILVKISDSGCGIPPALLPHIFDRFGEFRDIEHHSSRRSGLGLGLAICRHLVEMHDGAISAESVQGKGSTFSVFLPTG